MLLNTVNTQTQNNIRAKKKKNIKAQNTRIKCI